MAVQQPHVKGVAIKTEEQQVIPAVRGCINYFEERSGRRKGCARSITVSREKGQAVIRKAWISELTSSSPGEWGAGPRIPSGSVSLFLHNRLDIDLQPFCPNTPASPLTNGRPIQPEMIVLPMVGLSSRFFDAGYTLPKYQLPLHGRTVFAHVLGSFRKYFDSDEFLFICRADYGAERFIHRELHAQGVRHARIQVLAESTRGQADTVYRGTCGVGGDEELFIFNVDTFRPGFQKSALAPACDGYLEVFVGDGEHWSFVEPGPQARVRRTSEKQRISELCSDGLYHFRRKADFDRAFESARAEGDTVKGEFYVAPLYNRLIAAGLDIRYERIEPAHVVFCGTPVEYRALLQPTSDE
jgi:hypothetical protein